MYKVYLLISFVGLFIITNTFCLFGQSFPDLALEPYNKLDGPKWIDPFPPIANETTSVSVVVKNIGTAPVKDKFKIEFYVDNKLKQSWIFYPSTEGISNPLSPGETREYAHEVTLNAGNHNIRWVVDTENKIAESNESNNVLENKVDWFKSTDLPDLVVEDIWHEGQLILGESQIWKVRIKNQGKTNVSGNFLTTLKLADGSQFAAFSVNSLLAGQSIELETQQNPELKQATESIVGTVDVTNIIAEANEYNNQLQKDFTVTSVDLEIQDLTVTQEIGKTNYYISINVKNNGPSDALKPFKVKLWPGEFISPGRLVPILLDCPPLIKGSFVVLKHLASLPLAVDHFIAEADYPDPKKVYKETILDNNTYSKDFKRYVVLIILDGLRPDAFNAYLKGEMKFVSQSGLREILNSGCKTIETQHASTVFPSETLAANASIVTGLYPSHHGIMGAGVYKRDLGEWKNYETKEIGPTIYGFYEIFGKSAYNAVINGWQQTSSGCGGLDKDLEEFGVQTVYDILSKYKHPSHVVFHHYSKGAGYGLIKGMPGFNESLDGWDPPSKTELLVDGTLASNDDVSFFDHFDKISAQTATKFIKTNLPNNFPFPSLLTIYFDSIDHSSHILGLYSKSGNTLRDIQREYMVKIDQELYNVVKAIKDRFPSEFDRTVFIIASDHGHETVERNKVVRPKYILGTMLQSYDVDYIALNGTMAQIYLHSEHSPYYVESVLRMLCYYVKKGSGDFSGISTVIGRLPKDKIYKQFVYEGYDKIRSIPLKNMPDINIMFNNEKRSGDIILLTKQKEGWQFAESKAHATNLTIPFTPILNMRIPFSERFNTLSAHGGIDTMDTTLLFAGKCIPKSDTIQMANVVDITPTILNILCVPIPTNMDGKPLLDINLKPINQWGNPWGILPFAPSLPLSKEEVIKLPESKAKLIIEDINNDMDPDREFYKANRGNVTVIGSKLTDESISKALLVVDPDSESRKEFQIAWRTIRSTMLKYTFDSHQLSDGLHHILFEATTILRKKIISVPNVVIIDNTPPNLSRIDSATVYGESRRTSVISSSNTESMEESADSIERPYFEPSRSKKHEIIEIRTTVSDNIGVEKIQLYDGNPGTDGIIIGESYQIDEGECIILADFDRSQIGIHTIYLRTYDQAGNYLDSEPTKISVKF